MNEMEKGQFNIAWLFSWLHSERYACYWQSYSLLSLLMGSLLAVTLLKLSVHAWFFVFLQRKSIMIGREEKGFLRYLILLLNHGTSTVLSFYWTAIERSCNCERRVPRIFIKNNYISLCAWQKIYHFDQPLNRLWAFIHLNLSEVEDY